MPTTRLYDPRTAAAIRAEQAPSRLLAFGITALVCRGCGTQGWVLDIAGHEGRFPLCGGERFEYRIWLGGSTAAGPRLERLVEDDVAGADLVRRFHETRTSATDRYY